MRALRSELLERDRGINSRLDIQHQSSYGSPPTFPQDFDSFLLRHDVSVLCVQIKQVRVVDLLRTITTCRPHHLSPTKTSIYHQRSEGEQRRTMGRKPCCMESSAVARTQPLVDTPQCTTVSIPAVVNSIWSVVPKNPDGIFFTITARTNSVWFRTREKRRGNGVETNRRLPLRVIIRRGNDLNPSYRLSAKSNMIQSLSQTGLITPTSASRFHLREKT
jgi:hypothetical protein